MDAAGWSARRPRPPRIRPRCSGPRRTAQPDRCRRNKLSTAATRLHTSLDTVRYLLEIRPAPRPTRSSGTQVASVHNRAYCTAKAALPRERLVELYQRQRMSLRDIAATVGVSRQIIASLARDYDLPLREPRQYARKTVDRDWLYDQYVTKRRALPDIAEEAGMSTANMARWAETHAIPMRGRGGPSHSANLAAQRAVTDAPELIRPALAGIGGWERLHRFAAAARHGTLTVAAEELGVRSIHTGQPDQPHRARTRHEATHPRRAWAPNGTHRGRRTGRGNDSGMSTQGPAIGAWRWGLSDLRRTQRASHRPAASHLA